MSIVTIQLRYKYSMIKFMLCFEQKRLSKINGMGEEIIYSAAGLKSKSR